MKMVDFELKERLYHSRDTSIWRAVQKSDDQTVILKIQKTGIEDEGLKQEYFLLRGTSLQHAVPILGLFYDKDQTVLIRKDVPGVLLQGVVEQSSLSSISFLRVAQNLCQAIEEIHRLNIIHAGITPANILYEPEHHRVHLFDFSHAFSMNEAIEKENEDHKESQFKHLDYLAPEQTGRISRNRDVRSDYYALGCVFYALLAGRPPFWGLATLEKLHAHVAVPPTPFSALGIKVLPAIEAIVLKLLQKEPEDRYQTIKGVMTDLDVCLKAIEAGLEETLLNFVPGKWDKVADIRTPNTLYGRERELAQLTQWFHEAIAGEARLVLIAGYSGSGKTSLARRIRSQVKAMGGFFASGKFEEYRRNIPYFAITQALERLCEQWLLLEATSLKTIRSSIISAVGNQGRVITELVPKLEAIIGPQPDLIELGSIESQNRLDRVFQQFLAAVCSSHQPLVLFIDDLQWADYASLRALNTLLYGEVKNLLVLGSYRNNEVDSDHILTLSIEALSRLRPHSVSTLFVDNLSLKATNELVASMLQMSPDDSLSFSRVIYDKTQGNPFYSIELVKLSHAEQMLYWDEEADCWAWDEEKIKEQNVAANVVEVVIKKIGLLPEETLTVLKIGACIGREFCLGDVASIFKGSLSDTFKALSPAVEEGIIGSERPISTEFNDEPLARLNFFFLHDRLQEGAYRLMTATDTLCLHQQIGQMFYQRFKQDPVSLELHLMSIVQHLNAAISRLSSEEKWVLADLNRQAGIKAKSSSANTQAIQFLETAQHLFGEEAWTTHYGAMMSLHKHLYVCYYLNNEYAKADALFEQLKEKVQTERDQFDVYYNRMVQCMVVTDFKTTIETGYQYIERLGYHLPSSEEMQAALEMEENRLSEKLEEAGLSYLLDQPTLTVEREIYYVRALIRLLLTGYFTDYALFRYTLAKTLNLAFEEGIFPEIEVVLADYVLHLLNCEAYEFADETLQLAKKMADKTHGLKAEIWHFQSSAIDIWVNTWDDSIRNYYTAMAYCAEEGNQEYLGYALDTLVNDVLCKGEPLSVFEDAITKALAQLWKIQHTVMSTGVGMYRQFIKCLRGETTASDSFDGQNFSEVAYVQENQDNSLLLAYLYGFKSFALYVNGDYQAAYRCVVLGKPHREVVGCFHHSLYLKLYAALIYPMIIDQLTGQAKQEALDDWDQLIDWFDRLGHLNPANFLNKSLFVQAERAAYDGDFQGALFKFEDALERSEKSRVLSEAAMISERFGYFWLIHAREKRALTYFEKALFYYEEWGATEKIRRLKRAFPDLKDMRSPKGLELIGQGLSSQALDSGSILKAASALSGEIVLSALMEKLLHIVLEAAGADFAALIWVENEALFLEISRSVIVEERNQVGPIPFGDLSDDALPKSILQYVLRSKQHLVLNVFHEDHMFADDLYLKSEQRPRSLVCLPVMYQGAILCLLYLENSHMTGVFNQTRLELLHLIAVQAAVSIQNASLFSKLGNYKKALDDRIKDYTDHMNTLIASIAHEINTPVGIGITATSHVQEETRHILTAFDTGKLGKQQLNRYLKVVDEGIEMTSQNLNRVADLLHNFRRVALDQSLGELKDFDLLAYLQDVLYYLQPLIKKFPIQIELNGKGPLQVTSYPGAFSQILTNLINNSLLHAFENTDHEDPKIEIEVQLKTIDTLSITYRDNGCGMSEEQLTHIFEPLYTTKRDKGGSGLGGHIIHTLITQQLQGKISCKSTLGVGTEFSLELPKRLKKENTPLH